MARGAGSPRRRCRAASGASRDGRGCLPLGNTDSDPCTSNDIGFLAADDIAGSLQHIDATGGTHLVGDERFTSRIRAEEVTVHFVSRRTGAKDLESDRESGNQVLITKVLASNQVVRRIEDPDSDLGQGGLRLPDLGTRGIHSEVVPCNLVVASLEDYTVPIEGVNRKSPDLGARGGQDKSIGTLTRIGTVEFDLQQCGSARRSLPASGLSITIRSPPSRNMERPATQYSLSSWINVLPDSGQTDSG